MAKDLCEVCETSVATENDFMCDECRSQMALDYENSNKEEIITERIDPRPRLSRNQSWVRPNDFADPIYQYASWRHLLRTCDDWEIRIQYGFFTETWETNGPVYDSEEEARAALLKYGNSL